MHILVLLGLIGCTSAQNVLNYPAGTFPLLSSSRAQPLGSQIPLQGLGNLGYLGSNLGRRGSSNPYLYPNPPYSISPTGNWQRFFPTAQQSRILLPRHNSGLSSSSFFPTQSIGGQFGGLRTLNVAPGIVPSLANPGLAGRISPNYPLQAAETPATRIASRLQLLRSLRSRRSGADGLALPGASGGLAGYRGVEGSRSRPGRPEGSLRQLRALNLGLDNRQLRALMRRGGLSSLEPKVQQNNPIPQQVRPIAQPRAAVREAASKPSSVVTEGFAKSAVNLNDLPKAVRIVNSVPKPVLKELKISTAPVEKPKKPISFTEKKLIRPSVDKAVKPTIVKSARPCPRKDYSPCVTSEEFNKRALTCCRTLPSIPKGCYHLCNMDVTPFQITRALQSGTCPVGAFQPFLICLSEGRDLNPCCKAHRLTKGRKDICSAFCNPHQGFNPNAGFQYLRCIGQFRKLAACYWSSMN